jgi:hypothetical protein
MIVRILNEGQYVLPSLYYDDIHRIDNEIVEIIARNDEKSFNKAYAELIDMVRKYGTPLDPNILHDSNLILPPADLSLKEAKRIFVGKELIPG